MPASPSDPTNDRARLTRRAWWMTGLFIAGGILSAVYGAGVKPLLKAGGLIAGNSGESKDAPE